MTSLTISSFGHLLIATMLATSAPTAGGARELRLDQGDVASRDGAKSPGALLVPSGSLTTFADRATFDAAFPGLPIEDFEDGLVPPGASLTCGAPLTAPGDGTCFPKGTLTPGLVLADEPGPDMVDGLLLIGDGTFGNGSRIVASNTLLDSLLLSFPEPVEAVGLDLFNLPGSPDSLIVEVLGPGGLVIGSQSWPSSTTGEFFGVSSTSPIAALRLTSAINEAEAVDNVAFGVAPFLSFDGQSSVDRCAPLPSNENGVWEPNEEIALTVALRASGGSFTNLSGTLSATTPGIALLAATTQWPDLASGASASNQVPLRFVIDGDLCTQTVDLTLTVTSDQGSFTIPLSGRVGADQAPQVPLPLPDGPAEVTSTLEISTDVVLAGLEVQLEVRHTWVGDLSVILTSPAGTTVTLLDRPGVPASPFGCNNNDVVVTFSDAAALDPENSCSAASSDPWVTGFVLPTSALAAFDGESSQGTWALTVTDAVTGDLGSLVDWRLLHGEELGAECVACQQQSDLSLAKTCTSFPFSCQLEVTNLGVSTAFDIEVTDAIPAPLLWAADSCAAGPPAGNVLTWQLGSLDAGSSAFCQLDLTLPELMDGTVINVASVLSAVPDPDPLNNTAAAEIRLGTIVDVPTLEHLGLLALGLALSLAGLTFLRRQ